MAQLEGPREHTSWQKGTSKAQWLWCFPNVLRCRQRHHGILVWGHGGRYNRLFGINTSVTCFFQQANIFLGMSAICRKDYNMGEGGGGSHSQSDCTSFWKARMHTKYWPTPLTCLLTAPRSRWPHSGSHAGTCFCERRPGPAWAGGRGQGRKAAVGRFPCRQRNRKRVSTAQPLSCPGEPSGQLRVPGACWSILRQAHCKL